MAALIACHVFSIAQILSKICLIWLTGRNTRILGYWSKRRLTLNWGFLGHLLLCWHWVNFRTSSITKKFITWSPLLLINVCYYYLSYCGYEGETNFLFWRATSGFAEGNTQRNTMLFIVYFLPQDNIHNTYCNIILYWIQSMCLKR